MTVSKILYDCIQRIIYSCCISLYLYNIIINVQVQCDVECKRCKYISTKTTSNVCSIDGTFVILSYNEGKYNIVKVLSELLSRNQVALV